MARNTQNGMIHLLVNPSRESSTWGGFRLWNSSDSGVSFVSGNMNVPSNVTRADKPMIAVNNFTGLANSGYLYVAGTGRVSGGSSGVFVTYSSDGGTTWTNGTALGAGTHGADIVIRPDGTVYVFYLSWTAANGVYTTRIKYHWLPAGTSAWQGPQTVSAHSNSEPLYSTKKYGSGDLKRSNSASNDDYFVTDALPRVAVNPSNGKIYLVYADLPYAGSSTNRGDIFATEGTANAGGSLTWSSVRTINNDGTSTDQYLPSISVNPWGTQMFIGYYSRQDDPSNNALIKAYGAKANLMNGFASATFDVFPVGSSAFTNLFNGTTTSTPSGSPWLFDNVWVQTGVSFDSSARVVDFGSPNYYTGPVLLSPYVHFTADDYTWSSADGSHFYFAWRDCRELCTVTWNGTTYSRADPNIRFAKIKQ